MREGQANKTLGLVMGLGVGAGIFYYRSLVDACLARNLSPRIVMVHADVRTVMDFALAREAMRLAEYLGGKLHQLAAAGADFATIPAFSPQVCAEELQRLTPLPLLGLLDAIVAEVKEKGLRRVAIFGARVTMDTELFGRLREIAEVVSLSGAETQYVGELYRKIVETERASSEELDSLRSIALRLVESEGVDAILLAGTDFSFVFHPENTNFPHLDGARVHLRSIVRALEPI